MFGADTQVTAYVARITRKGDSSWLNILSWEEEGRVIAHCLELDIAASGTDEKDAIRALADAIVHQIEFSEQKNMEIFHPAPREFWEKLLEIHLNHVKQAIYDNPPKSPQDFLKRVEPAYA